MRLPMAVDAPLNPGTVLGDFEVIAPLARGGMGTVYTARRGATGETCALKVMHPELVHDARSRERFEREAELCARIESEHVVKVFASGVDESTTTPWIAMELVDGEDFEKLCRRRGAFPLGEAREILRQLYDGVAAAHRVGVVHRDLKPQNVLLAGGGDGASPGRVKVLDFGISKQSREQGTDTTAAVGSPLWMAPEQAQRGRLTPATDVFALALLTFRILTGRHYWVSATQARPTLKETLVELIMKPYPPASARARELGAAAPPAGFDAWFDRALDRDPARRHPDAGAAWEALSRVLSGDLAPRAEPDVPAADAAADAAPPATPVERTETPRRPADAQPRARVSSPGVSALRSPTPAPVPDLLDAARAARTSPPGRSWAFVATAAAVAVVLLVALAVALGRAFH